MVPLALDTAGVVSAAGVGLQPLADALRAGAVAGGAPPAAHEAEDYPPLSLRPADFAAADLLGPKGLNRLTRAEQLGMAACTLALGPVADRSATGVVLGSSVGSSGGVGRFTRDTFVQERPYMVNPSAFPGTLMNAAAGRTAIRHGLTDANATVSGGPLASLHALRFARNALVAGHARRLLTGEWRSCRRRAPGPGSGPDRSHPAPHSAKAQRCSPCGPSKAAATARAPSPSSWRSGPGSPQAAPSPSPAA